MELDHEYAIVTTGGFQVRVRPGRRVRIPKLPAEEGQEVVLDKVLLLCNKHGRWVGKPTIDGASVVTSVVSHGRTRKVRGFKFRRRVKYRRSWGHRQGYTELLVQQIRGPAQGGM